MDRTMAGLLPSGRTLGIASVEYRLHTPARPAAALASSAAISGLESSESSELAEAAQVVSWLVEYLQPSTPLEHWLIRQLDHSSSAADQATPRRPSSSGSVVSRQGPSLGSVAELLSAFEKLRGLTGSTWGKSVTPALETGSPYEISQELPLDPQEAFSPPRGVRLNGMGQREPVMRAFQGNEPPTFDAEPDVSELWRDRLQMAPETSESSPVVTGTMITVRHVVSLVVDGCSWARIRELHPELEEADIRACLAYCVEEEGGCVSLA